MNVVCGWDYVSVYAIRTSQASSLMCQSKLFVRTKRLLFIWCSASHNRVRFHTWINFLRLGRSTILRGSDTFSLFPGNTTNYFGISRLERDMLCFSKYLFDIYIYLWGNLHEMNQKNVSNIKIYVLIYYKDLKSSSVQHSLTLPVVSTICMRHLG